MADTTSAWITSLSRSCLKPKIYQTVDGKVVVEDELLNFVYVKKKIVSQNEFVILATNAFDSEWIEASKKTLFELRPTSLRNVLHKGVQNDANNLKSCIKVLKECGENVPRFLFYNLEGLPSVTLNNLNVSCLLKRMEQLSAEVATLKDTVKRQSAVSSGILKVTGRVLMTECYGKKIHYRTG